MSGEAAVTTEAMAADAVTAAAAAAEHGRNHHLVVGSVGSVKSSVCRGKSFISVLKSIIATRFQHSK